MKNAILFLSADFFFLSHFINRANLLKKQGCLVTVIARKTNQEIVDTIEKSGFNFFDSEIERKSISILGAVKNFLFVRKIYQELNPDIVHNFGTKSIFIGTGAAKTIKKKPLIVNNLVGLGYVYSGEETLKKILKLIINAGYRLFLDPGDGGVVIGENKEDLEYFIRNGSLDPKHARYIPGAGINLSKYRPLDEKNKRERITCIMCSRLIREKGVETYIKAAQLVKRQNPEIEFLLAGAPDKGNPSALSEEEIRRWEANNIIKYLGFKNNLHDLLPSTHIFCFPSFYREGLPRCLIEAAACGLPIITTDTIGCKDAVVNGNGILIPPKNYELLAEAILKIAQNNSMRIEMGELSRKLAEDVFDEKKILKKMREIYKL